jgi:hypothetical protein
MKKFPSVVMEQGRILHGTYGSAMTDGCNGAFVVKLDGRTLRVIASDGLDDDAQGWEHVSVSLKDRTPTWKEMCWVKDQFWDSEEAVFQLHPKRSSYVNYHPNCLHLWRHTVIPCPAPPSILVGPMREGNQ